MTLRRLALLGYLAMSRSKTHMYILFYPLNAKTIYICSRVPVSQREDHIYIYVEDGERSLSRLFIFIA